METDLMQLLINNKKFLGQEPWRTERGTQEFTMKCGMRCMRPACQCQHFSHSEPMLIVQHLCA